MITENIKKILQELPKDVFLEAVVKSRSLLEIKEAIDSGIKIIGENYIQETLPLLDIIDRTGIKLHFIGHLQKNKIKKAVEIFDMIETVDSFKVANEIDKAAFKINKVMPVLIEVNSGKETQKFGVIPEELEALIKKIVSLKNIKIMGLMTLGPAFKNIQDIRPFFCKTKEIFENIKILNLENVEMKYLSMGMSDSYKIAIQEGANIVRIGSLIFGPR